MQLEKVCSWVFQLYSCEKLDYPRDIQMRQFRSKITLGWLWSCELLDESNPASSLTQHI